MSLLQAYKADLLKDHELWWYLGAQANRWFGSPRRPPALLGYLWQLWWQQRDIYGWPCPTSKRRTGSLVPSGQFGDTVDTIVNRYQEACKKAAVFQRFLPHRSPAHAYPYRETQEPKTDLWAIFQARKASVKKPWCARPRAYGGSPLWGREVYTVVHGAHLSSARSGYRSANPGCLHLNRLCLRSGLRSSLSWSIWKTHISMSPSFPLTISSWGLLLGAKLSNIGFFPMA